jgi:uncharacterized protein (TIGR00369 family)
MFEVQNPRYRDYVAEKFRLNRFANHLGFSFTAIQPGRVEGELSLQDFLRQQNGFAHGGVLMSLCDIVAGFAAFTLVQEGEHVVTAEIKVSCLRPARGETLYSNGWVIKAGRNIHFCESEIWAGTDQDKKLVAKSSSSMAIVRAEGYGS